MHHGFIAAGEIVGIEQARITAAAIDQGRLADAENFGGVRTPLQPVIGDRPVIGCLLYGGQSMHDELMLARRPDARQGI